MAPKKNRSKKSSGADRKSRAIKPLTFTGTPCFIPAGAWNSTEIPIYNPNDQQKHVRILHATGNGAGFNVTTQDIYILGHSFQTFSCAFPYAIVEQFDV